MVNTFTDKQYSLHNVPAHRALSDVEALAELLADSPLVELLAGLPSRSAKTQVDTWRTQKDQNARSSKLLSSLGRCITAAQAKRLDSLGLSFDSLSKIRSSVGSVQEFQALLLERGVRSKPLREKLGRAVCP